MTVNEYVVILNNFKGILFWKINHINDVSIEKSIIDNPEDYLNISSAFKELKKKQIYVISENKNHISDNNPTIIINGKKKIFGNIIFVKKIKSKTKGLSINEVKYVIETAKAPTKIINTRECPEIEVQNLVQ